MMFSRLRVLIPFALGAYGLVGVSCTAILNPRDDVQRCMTADDCEATGDNRYVPECVPSGDPDVDNVCQATFKQNVGCNPMSEADDLFFNAYETLKEASRYTSCDENPGVQGCPRAVDGSCAPGLVFNEATGLCDDDNANTPTAFRAQPANDNGLETFGQDVLDQYCRSFFCDDRFVCDTTTNSCVICDADEEFGEGGCGQIYVAGAPSCVYQTTQELSDQCAGAQVDRSDVSFGVAGACAL